MKAIVPLLALAALASPALASAAAPYDPSDVAVVRVSDRGLDLDRAQDASVMLRRISTAALEACGASDFSIPEYRRSVLNSSCYRASLDQAVRQLNAPAVSALYGQNMAQPATTGAGE